MLSNIKKAFTADFSVRVVAMLSAVLVLMLPEIALAGGTATTGGGAGGSSLDAVFADLAAYTQGTLGKIITLLFIVAGIGAGIARQSVFAIVTGVGAGLILYNAKAIVDALFTAVF